MRPSSEHVSRQYSVPNSAPTTSLTVISSVFITGVIAFLLFVGYITKSIHEDVNWGLSSKESAIGVAKVGVENQSSNDRKTRARLSNVPEQFSDKDELELLHLRNGDIDQETLKGNVVNELIKSGK